MVKGYKYILDGYRVPDHVMFNNELLKKCDRYSLDGYQVLDQQQTDENSNLAEAV